MEPAVPVEQHEPEVPVTSGPAPPAAAVEAGTAAPAAGTAREGGTTAAGTVGVAGTTAAADTAGRLEARTGVAAGSNGNNLPLLVLHL